MRRIRMEERGITTRDLLNILSTGYVYEAPVLTDRREWKCKVVKRIRGSREAGAVTVISRRGHLIVITVQWEDLR